MQIMTSLENALATAIEQYHQGNTDVSINILQQILKHDPTYVAAYHNLIIIFIDQQRLTEASQLCQKAPQDSITLFLMGKICYAQENNQQALFFLKESLKLNPNNSKCHNLLGHVLLSIGNIDSSIDAYTQAIQLSPSSPGYYNNLGTALRSKKQAADAIENFKKAIELNPQYAEAYNNLGSTLFMLGQLQQAANNYNKALQLAPPKLKPYINMGSTLVYWQKYQEALKFMQQGLKEQPDNTPGHSSVLFHLNYFPDIPPKDIFEQYRLWNKQHTANITPYSKHTNNTSPTRKLKIGYLSADFRTHSVSYFFKPIITNHSSNYETYCYSNVLNTDATTNEIKNLTSHWRNIYGIKEHDIATLIKNDNIDILVDLSGHTSDNKILVFAYKPAPIQIAYLGYPNTTGLDTMDYRIVDNNTDPKSNVDLYTEKLVKMDGCFLCYSPPSTDQKITSLPFNKNGYITFGSFNNICKINHHVIKTWATILNAISNTKLILKSRFFEDEITCNNILNAFSSYDIDPSRISLLKYQPNTKSHLDLYNEIDIALDTFPYNGTTTSCEALWMGVPVITLQGNTHASRVSYSILTSLGLDDLKSTSLTDYITKATTLANDIDKLTYFRQNLRNIMTNSPLTDSETFTQQLENEYRKLWQKWTLQSKNEE